MKRLLLKSIGVNSNNFEKYFKELLEKDVSKTRIALISMNKSSALSIYYIGMDIKGFYDLGVKLENMSVYSLSEDENINLKKYDVIFMCGGNTYHYLNGVRKLGLDKQIIEHVNKGKLYIGESAGSILATPNIITSSVGSERQEADENDIGLKDLTGLKIVDFLISPHYVSAEKEQIRKIQEKINKKIIAISDKKMIIVKEDKVKIV